MLFCGLNFRTSNPSVGVRSSADNFVEVRRLCTMEYLYVVLVALAVLKTAESLHCWKCQSTDDGPCGDYFNETKIRNSPRIFGSIDTQIPTEENCETFLGFQIRDQKPVCMKKTQMVHGRKHYTRKCEFIHVDLPVGECLKQVSEDRHVQDEYCQYCNTETCNGSNTLNIAFSWLISIPVISILSLRL